MNREEQIRCFQSLHPIIRFELDEDGRKIPFVKTPDDDRHFTDIAEEIQQIVLEWIYWNMLPSKSVYKFSTSYGMKHVLQGRTKIYLSNNQFKEAMLMKRFWPVDPFAINWSYRLKASSPVFKDQADGHPGLPVIGKNPEYYENLSAYYKFP